MYVSFWVAFSIDPLLSYGVQKTAFSLCMQGFGSFFDRASAQPWCAKIYAFACVRKVLLVFAAEHLLSHGVRKSSFCFCTQGLASFCSRASAQPWCAQM